MKSVEHIVSHEILYTSEKTLLLYPLAVDHSTVLYFDMRREETGRRGQGGGGGGGGVRVEYTTIDNYVTIQEVVLVFIL